MFVTPAQAHSAIDHTVFDHQTPVLAQLGGGSDMLMSILPFILMKIITFAFHENLEVKKTDIK